MIYCPLRSQKSQNIFWRQNSKFIFFQVLAPNDVQFSLPLNNLENEAEEVVISYDAQDNSSLCVDTSAFVGVTVAFIMILVVALITIIFLWLRIKSLDTSKRCF